MPVKYIVAISTGLVGGIARQRLTSARIQKCSDRLRWLGLSLCWSSLLLLALSALFGLTRPATPVLAAGPAQKPPQPIKQDESAVSFSSGSYTASEAILTDSIVLLVDPPSLTPVTLTVSSANI